MGEVSLSSLESLYNFLFLVLCVMTIFLTQLESLDIHRWKGRILFWVHWRALTLRKHNAIKSQKSITQPYPYPRTFWYLTGWLPKFILEKALQQTSGGSCRFLHPSLQLSGDGRVQIFFLAVNWASSMRKFLLILSDYFFFHARHVFLHNYVPIYKEFHRSFLPLYLPVISSGLLSWFSNFTKPSSPQRFPMESIKIKASTRKFISLNADQVLLISPFISDGLSTH